MPTKQKLGLVAAINRSGARIFNYCTSSSNNNIQKCYEQFLQPQSQPDGSSSGYCGCIGGYGGKSFYEACVNGVYYGLVEETSNNYAEFGFGYVFATDIPQSDDMSGYVASGVMDWYFGNKVDTSNLTTALPTGGIIVASGSASNCYCSGASFGYDNNPFTGPTCNGGKYPETPYNWS